MSARSVHRMPFGAEIQDDGSVRLALWAPAQHAVTAMLAGGRAEVPMSKLEDGWFQAEIRAHEGETYIFALEDGTRVPDPASRSQRDSVHGASVIVDPASYEWRCNDWMGRPWEETVLYELHTGTFTPEGTYDGVRGRLDHLVDLGITAIELMPVADFPGRRNWGYDGVLPFAPARAYGSPNALKRLIDEAHERGLMVFLDVVYNHFGPEGNYLHKTAPTFFTEAHHTPWGAAIDFSRRPVREFYIENALYWIEEYRIDGLRFDAVHAILDESDPHILTELAERVRAAAPPGRHLHLVLENDANESHHLERGDGGACHHYTAQWNDDFHHAAHVLLTGERAGYYVDYAGSEVPLFGRALSEGFAYQGEISTHRDGEVRGEPSRHMPPTAFVSFLQNHDQIGNRAFGERLPALAGTTPLATLVAATLLAPSVPLLFMGEEWGAEQPFLFFCDFDGELAAAVREGRRREFAHFPAFRDPDSRARIPDPNSEETFRRSLLDWSSLKAETHAKWLRTYRELLDLRRREIVPRLAGLRGNSADAERLGTNGLRVRWTLGDGSLLTLACNVGPEPCPAPPLEGRTIFTSTFEGAGDTLPPWSIQWTIEERESS